MKRIVTILLAGFLCSVSIAASESELARVASPDGHAVAIVSQKVQRGMWMPGPEPPKVKAQYVRLRVTVDGKETYDSGLEDVGEYQPCQFAYDIAWAPDSAHVAFRAISTLRVVGKDGQTNSFELLKDNSLISSFKWTGNRELLVVAKKVSTPLGMHGYPKHYHGYLAKAHNVKLFRVNLDSGITDRFTLDTKDASSTDPYLYKSKDPTFMFQSIVFFNQEISPTANRFAFSDGNAICVYDDVVGKVIARAPVIGSIEGTWWDTNDRLIVGIGLLSGKKQFSTFDIPTETLKEKSSVYLPLWTGAWNNADWFRTGKK
jgi:hypothetical protein